MEKFNRRENLNEPVTNKIDQKKGWGTQQSTIYKHTNSTDLQTHQLSRNSICSSSISWLIFLLAASPISQRDRRGAMVHPPSQINSSLGSFVRFDQLSNRGELQLCARARCAQFYAVLSVDPKSICIPFGVPRCYIIGTCSALNRKVVYTDTSHPAGIFSPKGKGGRIDLP